MEVEKERKTRRKINTESDVIEKKRKRRGKHSGRKEIK